MQRRSDLWTHDIVVLQPCHRLLEIHQEVAMRRPFTRGRAPGPAVLFLAALPLRAQAPQATLDVRTATGLSTFHVGERIPLQLTFTSPNDTQYVIAPYGNDGPEKNSIWRRSR